MAGGKRIKRGQGKQKPRKPPKQKPPRQKISLKVSSKHPEKAHRVKDVIRGETVTNAHLRRAAQGDKRLQKKVADAATKAIRQAASGTTSGIVKKDAKRVAASKAKAAAKKKAIRTAPARTKKKIASGAMGRRAKAKQR